MKTKLQQLIESLASKHSFDLSLQEEELILTIDESPYHLVIVPFDSTYVRIFYRVLHARGWYNVPNDVAFYTEEEEWVLDGVLIETLDGLHAVTASQTRQEAPYSVSLVTMEDAIALVELWADKLSIEGWLANGIVVDPSSVPIRPSFAELTVWIEDGCSPALDGCWILSDEHCEHGHPSWLLYYGLN